MINNKSTIAPPPKSFTFKKILILIVIAKIEDLH